MFKSRQAQAPVSPFNPPSIEWVRQRAKHRLLGVSVLVLAGVLLFPMLFDTQPRPIPVDIPIEIPSRQTAPPLKIEPRPKAATAAVPDGDTVTASSAKVPSAQSVAADEEVIIERTAPAPAARPPALSVPEQAAAPKVAPASQDKPAQAAEPVKPPVAQPKPAAVETPSAAAMADAARAKALLEGKPVPKAAAVVAEGRFIVQVGAFAETARAQQVRQQLERGGLKTYTHVATTAEGKRIRVRLGPFASRAEADKAAAKAKALGLPAAILTL